MIRLAEASDAERIGQLWLEMVAFHAAFDPEMFRPTENGAELYARSVRDRIHDPQARILVAELDGEVVGYVNGMIADITTEIFQPLRCGLLSDIYVAGSYRGHGLGRTLVERLTLWFRSAGIRYFEWHVSAKNKEALAFWDSIGGETTILRMRAEIEEEKI